jgi:hypothetical protein
MATINYPTQLLMPIQDGYSVQHVSPLLRTQMQSGRARQRRIFTSVPSMVSVSFFFQSAGEAQLFEGFFQHTLKDGAEWFNMPLKTPMGSKNYECRFTDIYGPIEPQNDYWRTSAQLEIRERETITAEWVAFPEFVTQQDIIDIAINRELPEA